MNKTYHKKKECYSMLSTLAAIIGIGFVTYLGYKKRDSIKEISHKAINSIEDGLSHLHRKGEDIKDNVVDTSKEVKEYIQDYLEEHSLAFQNRVNNLKEIAQTLPEEAKANLEKEIEGLANQFNSLKK